MASIACPLLLTSLQSPYAFRDVLRSPSAIHNGVAEAERPNLAFVDKLYERFRKLQVRPIFVDERDRLWIEVGKANKQISKANCGVEPRIGRFMLGILGKYFPAQESWTVVPEFRTEDKKVQDLVVEKYKKTEISILYLRGIEIQSVQQQLPKGNQTSCNGCFLHFDNGAPNDGFLVAVRGSIP